MKAYVATSNGSHAIQRVAKALAQYAPPSVEIVTDEASANLVVLHVNGRRDRFTARARALMRARKRYAVVQYVLRSTQKPQAGAWYDLWVSAACVWSYLDLATALGECWDEPATGPPQPMFYHAPLGVDATIFTPDEPERRESTTTLLRTWTIATSGASWLTESVRECVLAAECIGGHAWHLGAELRRPGLSCVSGIPDRTLAHYYRATQFVSGLRRLEGFELPAAEGLLCGARPVLFDRDHYRIWYGTWADYIQETDRAGVIDQLETLFRRGACPVTAEERADAVRRFHWPTLVQGFWDRCLVL